MISALRSYGICISERWNVPIKANAERVLTFAGVRVPDYLIELRVLQKIQLVAGAQAIRWLMLDC